MREIRPYRNVITGISLQNQECLNFYVIFKKGMAYLF